MDDIDRLQSHVALWKLVSFCLFMGCLLLVGGMIYMVQHPHVRERMIQNVAQGEARIEVDGVGVRLRTGEWWGGTR